MVDGFHEVRAEKTKLKADLTTQSSNSGFADLRGPLEPSARARLGSARARYYS